VSLVWNASSSNLDPAGGGAPNRAADPGPKTYASIFGIACGRQRIRRDVDQPDRQDRDGILVCAVFLLMGFPHALAYLPVRTIRRPA